MQILRNVTGHRPNDGPRPGSHIDKIIQYQEDKINEIPKYGRIFFVVKSPKLLHSRGPNGSRAKSPAPQGPTDRGRPQHLGDHPTGNAVPGCPPPLGALIRTPREGCPDRDPRRERRPRRSCRRRRHLDGWQIEEPAPKENTSLRTSAHTGVVTEGNACGAIPEIKRNLPLVVPAKSRGLPRPYGPRNDVFFFIKIAPRREPGGFGVT